MKIGLVGNINLGVKVDHTICSYNRIGNSNKTLYSIWGNTLDNLHSHDILSGNLNSVITDNKYTYTLSDNSSDNPIDTVDYSYLKKNYARCLIPTKINHLSIANKNMIKSTFNNFFGLNDTITTLDKMRIGYSGANIIKGFESEPHFITTNGYTVGFLSATEDWIADYSNDQNELNNYYIWKLSRDKNMGQNDKIKHFNAIRKIQTTKEMCDILIITLNWGDSFAERVSNIIINFCRLFIDNGADIVQCTGINNIMPIEMYGKGFIFYSLGNFINGDIYSYNDSEQYIKYQSDLSAIATIEYPQKIEEKTKEYHRNIGILTITPTVSLIKYGNSLEKVNVNIASIEDGKNIIKILLNK